MNLPTLFDLQSAKVKLNQVKWAAAEVGKWNRQLTLSRILKFVIIISVVWWLWLLLLYLIIVVHVSFHSCQIQISRCHHK